MKNVRSSTALMSRLLMPLVAAIVSLGALSSQSEAAPSAPQKFALLVGIDDYQYVDGFNGCVNDVRAMRDVLAKKFQFPNNNAHIRTLTDNQATGPAILKAFEQFLIGNAKKYPDAIVVFYFSGHGSTVDDQPNGDEPDKLDETLVPVDSRDDTSKHYDVTDDELDMRIQSLSKYTKNITIILDSCHSGTATKAVGIKEIKKDKRPQPFRPNPPRTDESRFDFIKPDNSIVLIAGCKSDEKSEMMPNGKQSALTYHLVRELWRATPQTSYLSLINAVRDRIIDVSKQTPQIEGDSGRFVLSGTALREDPGIPMRRDSWGNNISIGAGTLQNVNKGSLLAIYAPGTILLKGEKGKLSDAIVDQAFLDFSIAKMPKALRIPKNARVTLVAPNFSAEPFRVAFDTSDTSLVPLFDKVQKELQDRKLLNSLITLSKFSIPAVGTSKITVPYDVAVIRNEYRMVFPDEESLSPELQDMSEPNQKDKVIYLAGRSGTPLFGWYMRATNSENSTEEKVSKITDKLVRAARQRNVLSLVNEASSLNSRLAVNVYRVPGTVVMVGDREKFVPSGKATQVWRSNNHYSFPPKAKFYFNIKNNSNKGLYVTIMDISNDGTVLQVFPVPGASGNKLMPGKSFTVPKPPWYTSAPPGLDVFKIFFTDTYVDFSYLQFKGRSTTPKSPLALLIRQAAHGLKANPGDDVDTEEWTTEDVVFRITKPND